MTALALVLCAVGSAWLLVPPPPDARLRLLAHETAIDPARAAPTSGRASRLMPWLAGGVAGLALLLLVGGVVGVVGAVMTVVGVPRLARRMESAKTRERRERLERQGALTAELLAATLASGAPMLPALESVRLAVGEPMSGALRPVVVAIHLGADPRSAWSTVDDVEVLRPVAEAVSRSLRSGAPLSTLLSRVAADMRRDRHRQVDVASRTAGVRAVAPLAACFLPAFLLVGVVPVVASLAGSLLH